MRKAFTEIPAQVPEIKRATQIFRGWTQTLNKGADLFINGEVYYADKDFFEVFGLKLLSGNQEDALGQKYKLVLPNYKLNTSMVKEIYSRKFTEEERFFSSYHSHAICLNTFRQ